MKNLITRLLITITLSSCGLSDSKSKVISEEKANFNIEKFHYDSLTIPLFFHNLIRNHLKDFYLIDSLEFNHFCSENNISLTDSSNIEKFFTIKILHKIFSSQTASDCSSGEIINIPYQWHWVNPNPRHEIYFTGSNELLKNTKPPNDFSNYKSFADIDRTPYLFLSDLVNPDLKYYSTSCDTFSTFGWCSEREMAFVALINLLEFEGKIIAEGNHCWSEILISLKLNSSDFENFKVSVDNTFNTLGWTTISHQELSNWKVNFGSSNLAGWYNRKANSKKELNRIENHCVSNKAMLRIENKIVEYLKKKINEH